MDITIILLVGVGAYAYYKHEEASDLKEFIIRNKLYITYVETKKSIWNKIFGER